MAAALAPPVLSATGGIYLFAAANSQPDPQLALMDERGHSFLRHMRALFSPRSPGASANSARALTGTFAPLLFRLAVLFMHYSAPIGVIDLHRRTGIFCLFCLISSDAGAVSSLSRLSIPVSEYRSSPVLRVLHDFWFTARRFFVEPLHFPNFGRASGVKIASSWLAGIWHFSAALLLVSCRQTVRLRSVCCTTSLSLPRMARGLTPFTTLARDLGLLSSVGGGGVRSARRRASSRV